MTAASRTVEIVKRGNSRPNDALTSIGDEEPHVMYRPILATLAVTGMILGGVVGVASANETPASSLVAPPGDVRAEPAAAPGLDPFAPAARG